MAPLLSTPLLLRTQSDRRLATLAADGHDRAFEAIVERYRRPLQRYLRRLLSEALAEDVLQATFVRAWQALRAGTEVRDLRPWLYRIAHNQALNTLRAAGAALPAATEDFAAVSLEAHVERREELRETLDGIQALPERQRAALVAVAVADRPHADVARRAGHERRRPAPAPAARAHDAARRRDGADALPAGDVAGRRPGGVGRARGRGRRRRRRRGRGDQGRRRACSPPERWWPVAPRCATSTRPRAREGRARAAGGPPRGGAAPAAAAVVTAPSARPPGRDQARRVTATPRATPAGGQAASAGHDGSSLGGAARAPSERGARRRGAAARRRVTARGPAHERLAGLERLRAPNVGRRARRAAARPAVGLGGARAAARRARAPPAGRADDGPARTRRHGVGPAATPADRAGLRRRHHVGRGLGLLGRGLRRLGLGLGGSGSGVRRRRGLRAASSRLRARSGSGCDGGRPASARARLGRESAAGLRRLASPSHSSMRRRAMAVGGGSSGSPPDDRRAREPAARPRARRR